MPAGPRWNRNPDSAQLPEVSVGDEVVCQFDGFANYEVKAVVVEIVSNGIAARISSAFDRNLSAQVHGGTEISPLFGTTHTFSLTQVFRVIKQ